MKYLNLVYESNPNIITIPGDDSELTGVYNQLSDAFIRYRQFEFDLKCGRTVIPNPPMITVLLVKHAMVNITIDITKLCHFSMDDKPLKN